MEGDSDCCGRARADSARIVVTMIVQQAKPRRRGNSEGGSDADGGAYNAPKKGAEVSEGDAGGADGSGGGGGGGGD